MTGDSSPPEFLERLRNVLAGSAVGKHVWFWMGGGEHLRALLADTVAEDDFDWLDINGLAKDFVPRRAAPELLAALERFIDASVAAGRRVLVLEHPYLLLKYFPAAPLGIFWNRYVSDSRALVVVLPDPVPRPEGLPEYVRFRCDDPCSLFPDVKSGVPIVRER